MQITGSGFPAVDYSASSLVPSLTQIRENPSPETLAKLQWRHPKKKRVLLCEQFASQASVAELTELLRAFIINSSAEIEQVEADFAQLNIEYKEQQKALRTGYFNLQIEFQTVQESSAADEGFRKFAVVRIMISEGRKKWFSRNELSFAPAVFREIRRCLMISDDGCRLKLAF